MSTLLYDTVKTASKITDRTTVFLSGGKDSVVTLDLCCRVFKHVDVVYMYLVDGLSFVESILGYYEHRYGISIHRVPHFMLSEWLRYGTFRNYDLDVPIVSVKQIYDYCRELTGTYWISAGERCSDSIVRNAMIKQSSSIDHKRGRFYPVAYWKKGDILNYVKKHKLRISPESDVLGFSFRSMMPKDMYLIKKHYPEDFERIKEWFPLVEASVKKYELNQISEL